MMNKRGVIFIFSLLAASILSVLLAAFYFQAISENQLATRYVDSARAFWLAEAGIAQVKSNLGIAGTSGYLDNVNYTYNVPAPVKIGATQYYTVNSIGKVTAPSGRIITRTISVTMKLIPPDASKLQYGVETTSVNMSYQNKNIVNDEYPGQKAKQGSSLTFSDIFGVSKATLEAQAQANGTHLTDPSGTISASGITWVDVTGSLLEIQHLNGSGVVVIEGDFKLTGTGSFDGILYVIGSLTVRGNPLINGTVFVESAADLSDTVDLQGSPGQIVYKQQMIADALVPLTSSKSVVSWREI